MARRPTTPEPHQPIVPHYDPALGWVAVPDVLTRDQATELSAACQQVLAGLGDDLRVGDKPASGTRRLVSLSQRIPAVAAVTEHPGLEGAVRAVLDNEATLAEVIFRSPEPGFGSQRLHADAIPRVSAEDASTCATAIVALVDFEPGNGATVVVPGSHLRPDLQRLSGRVESLAGQMPLTGPAGTGFVFDGHLLHGGSRNDSDRPRPALQITWLAGSAAPPEGTPEGSPTR